MIQVSLSQRNLWEVRICSGLRTRLPTIVRSVLGGWKIPVSPQLSESSPNSEF